MRIFILQLARFFYLLGVFVLILVGTTALLAGKFLAAFLCLLGIPMALAQVIALDYVRKRLAQPAADTALRQDTSGTPWQNNPGHTL